MRQPTKQALNGPTANNAASRSKSEPSALLVVEDDADVRTVLADVLESDGYLVETANDGSDALRKLSSMPRLPAAILLDLMMPVMSGWEFREAQLRDPTFKGIPVIIVTASGLAHTISAAAVLRKPFDLDVLVRTVDAVAGRPGHTHGP